MCGWILNMSLIKGFVLILTENLHNSDSCLEIPKEFDKFALAKPLPMRLSAYIDHFLYQLELEETLLSCTFLIIERFFKYISSNNIQKLVFAALTISYKAFIDKPVKNSTLERIGVLKKGELYALEKIVIEWINWDLEYCRIEEIFELLIEEAKEEEIFEEEKESFDYETDFTECERSESFSELSGFFDV